MRASRLGLGLALALLTAGAVYAALAPVRDVLRGEETCTDFDSFLFGAQAVLDGESYYDYLALQRNARRAGRSPGKLPATTAPVFSTLPFMALLPLSFSAARLVWYAGTLLALGAAFLAIRAGLVSAWREPWPAWRDRALGVLALALLASHAGVAHHFCHGQTNIHMLMLLALAAALLVSARPAADALVGLCLALAILSKLYPAILLPLLVLAGRWRALAWTAALAALLLAASLPLTGIGDYLRYPGYFSGTYYVGAGADVAHNLSFRRALHLALAGRDRVSGVAAGALGALAAVPVAFVYARLWLERRRLPGLARPELHLLARYWQVLLLVGCIMASTWEYHLVLSFGALALLWCWEPPRWPPAWPTACVAASLVLSGIPTELLAAFGALAPVRQAALVLIAVALEPVIRGLARERAASQPVARAEPRVPARR